MIPLQTVEFEGCRLAYRITGKGPPLLMIQGVGAYGATGSNPLFEILEKQYSCLGFDNRGMGASQPAGTSLTVDQMAADTIAVMDHAQWPSAHIMGHSLGGLVALQLALRDRARVRSLAVLCSFASGIDATRMTPTLFWILLRLRFAPRRFRRQAFMELVLPRNQQSVNSDDLAKRFSAVLGHDIADIPSAVDQQLKALRRHDVTAHLRELSGIPTLVINATEDLIASPRLGRAIATEIATARFVEVPGTSHSLPVLEAERCCVLLFEHLSAAESSFQLKES